MDFTRHESHRMLLFHLFLYLINQAQGSRFVTGRNNQVKLSCNDTNSIFIQQVTSACAVHGSNFAYLSQRCNGRVSCEAQLALNESASSCATAVDFFCGSLAIFKAGVVPVMRGNVTCIASPEYPKGFLVDPSFYALVLLEMLGAVDFEAYGTFEESSPSQCKQDGILSLEVISTDRKMFLCSARNRARKRRFTVHVESIPLIVKISAVSQRREFHEGFYFIFQENNTAGVYPSITESTNRDVVRGMVSWEILSWCLLGILAVAVVLLVCCCKRVLSLRKKTVQLKGTGTRNTAGECHFETAAEANREPSRLLTAQRKTTQIYQDVPAFYDLVVPRCNEEAQSDYENTIFNKIKTTPCPSREGRHEKGKKAWQRWPSAGNVSQDPTVDNKNRISRDEYVPFCPQ